MGRRFSRIKEGQKLADAWTAYVNYWNTASTRPSRIGQGTPRQLDAMCFIQPFTISVNVGEVVSAKAYNDSYTTLATYINASSVAEVSNNIGASTMINIPKFRPARVRWQRAVNRAISTPTSKFTQQEYLKYENVDSFSCPFGATADTDDMIDSFLDVKARVLAVTGFEVSRVSLTREQVGIEAA
ncbi:hypothetical protein VB780_07205 [Leptolyngbya sp. CCNP1308]|uniref:hypothetical protein n=1 Tax=Leptolyngbya sp. CCNP1308 TaxID=3110255 RepID=UPI002B20BFDB|nr:hypothetical protein [Leptolyngbya sp. CCNP1308]MEA5448349.1 hypothetical protein [Leptolyngbya sp. CCNP1308]